MRRPESSIQITLKPYATLQYLSQFKPYTFISMTIKILSHFIKFWMIHLIYTQKMHWFIQLVSLVVLFPQIRGKFYQKERLILKKLPLPSLPLKQKTPKLPSSSGEKKKKSTILVCIDIKFLIIKAEFNYEWDEGFWLSHQ